MASRDTKNKIGEKKPEGKRLFAKASAQQDERKLHNGDLGNTVRCVNAAALPPPKPILQGRKAKSNNDALENKIQHPRLLRTAPQKETKLKNSLESRFQRLKLTSATKKLVSVRCPNQDTKTELPNLLTMNIAKPSIFKKKLALVSRSNYQNNINVKQLLRKEPLELMKYIVTNTAQLNNYLAQKLNFDEIADIVILLGKVSNTTTNAKLTKDIFTKIHTNICNQIEILVMNLSLSDGSKSCSKVYDDNPNLFWAAIGSIINFMNTNIPELRILLIRIIKMCLITIKSQKSLDECIEVGLKELYNDCQDIDEQLHEEYQLINHIPKVSDIRANKRPFVRENITIGPYESASYYLDTHFRLLREDFLGPIRTAFNNYTNKLRNTKIPEFIEYPKTTFIQRSLKNNFGFEESLTIVAPGHCTKRNAVQDKSFMDGSLLLFSDDNFETIYMGTVKNKIDNRVGVTLFNYIPFMYKRTFTMLQCSTYFGPYGLVLKVLQEFRTKHFPMEEYILKVHNVQKPPEYLTDTTEYRLNKCKFVVLKSETWPNANILILNEVQYEAFKYALTSQFSIIQGPPGTGKTYLGIKIAGALIRNMYAVEAHVDRHTPILVVSYTNHALDQFLEGCLRYTRKIIRIGKQSKNDAVRKLTYKGARYGSGLYRDIESEVHDRYQLQYELESALSQSGIYCINKLAESNSDLFESKLYMKNKDELVQWLMGDRQTKAQRTTLWRMTLEISTQEKVLNQSHQTHQNHIRSFIDIRRCIKELKTVLDEKCYIEISTIFVNYEEVQEEYECFLDEYEYVKWRLSHAEDHIKLYDLSPISLENPETISYNDRWILYFHWLENHTMSLKKQYEDCNLEIQNLWKEVREYKQSCDSCCIEESDVVGITTSGAALHRTLLENLDCRIVIIEEAAEVLESHVVASLTHGCQQLILLGDHKQLRPSCADYDIEKNYKLGISLFERMILNGVNYKTLEVQHRMRPEICKLIMPTIYKTLINHHSVSAFPHIKGIKSNLFFVTHVEPEEHIGISKANSFESQYIVALARHLLLQGYSPTEITILTNYKGQMHQVKDECRSRKLQDIYVTTVDNFQGEENRIILLSLVRSNQENKVGFVGIENRICVSLSRAREGLYIIGNMETLANGSRIWSTINDILKSNNEIGPGLHLVCQLHPEDVTIAMKPSDFKTVPDGGCKRNCNAVLECGHNCTRKCHVIDVDHSAYKCQYLCKKILCEDGHACPRLCHEKCQDCKIPINISLKCGHEASTPCYLKTEPIDCKIIVTKILNCGHKTGIFCYIKHMDILECAALVNFEKNDCGHILTKKCFEDGSTVPCTEIVDVSLQCGHTGSTTCYKGSNDLPICNKKCDRVRLGCQTNHRCGNICGRQCLPCDILVPKKLLCGHFKNVLCKETVLRHQCIEKYCNNLKPCGHKCFEKCHGAAGCPNVCSFKVIKQFLTCKHSMKTFCSDDMKKRACRICLKF